MHFYKILLVSLLLISCKDKVEQPVKTEIKKITKKIPKQTKKEFLLNDDNAIPFFFEYGKKNKENKVRIITSYGNIDIEFVRARSESYNSESRKPLLSTLNIICWAISFDFLSILDCVWLSFFDFSVSFLTSLINTDSASAMRLSVSLGIFLSGEASFEDIIFNNRFLKFQNSVKKLCLKKMLKHLIWQRQLRNQDRIELKEVN